jgi:photosystem II stability/assembly factor-like uncharacterized protein
MTNKYTMFVCVLMALIIASCGSQPNDVDPGEHPQAKTPVPQEGETSEADTPSEAEEPCVLIPNLDVPTFYRPDLESEPFEIMPSGMPVYVFAESVNGWIGFDPGIPQAANVGPFRLRWVQKTGDISLHGACDALPVIEPPPTGVCFTMAMTEFPVFEAPSVESKVITIVESEAYLSVTSQPSPGWYQVDLSVGSVGLEGTGWVQSEWINLNGPCGDLLLKPPSGPEMVRFPGGEDLTISHVQMVSPTTGWAIGHQDPDEDHILYSQDGGLTWKDISPAEPGIHTDEPRKKALGAFLDEETSRVAYRIYEEGPASYKLRFWSTDDGGSTWLYGGETNVNGINELDLPMKFSDPSHGWLLHETFAGAGQHRYQFLRTDDGGFSYENLHETIDTTSTCHSTDFVFSDPSHGWRTLNCPFEQTEGKLLATTEDGGSSWEQIALPAPRAEKDLFQTATNCWTSSPTMHSLSSGSMMLSCTTDGGTQDERNFIYITDDGGRSWETHEIPGGQMLFLNPSQGWILGKDIFWSDDGGRGWTKVKTVSWEGQFSFVSPNKGWAVAIADDVTALVTTSDGGETWQIIESITAASDTGGTNETSATCKLTATGSVTAFNRPSFAAEEFADLPGNMPLRVGGRSPDGWWGFDPAYAQAANIGVFRLRWVPPDSTIELDGDCESVPLVEGPKPGICFTMPMSETLIYALPDTSEDVLVVLNAGDYVEVEGRYGEDWMRVDLSEGNIGMPTKGWMEASFVNFNCPDTNLGEVTP